MKQYTTIDKTDWGDGPWQHEPDKIVWIDPTTDLDCMIHRGNSGALCGYVGVSADHPDYGRSAYELEDIDIHGGLSFADRCDDEAREDYGICHVPEPGRTHDVWWLGFDCAHAFDVMPKLESQPYFPLPREFRAIYRDVAYVIGEVTSLALQLANRKEQL